jgi:hypothetical protein
MSATSVAVNSPPTPEKRNKNHLIEDVVVAVFPPSLTPWSSAIEKLGMMK